MQQPGRYDLRMYRGDSYAWRVIVWEDQALTVPSDLTGATVAAEIRERYWGTTVVELGAVVTPPNIIDLTMSPDMWPGCPVAGVWDLQVTTSPDEVHTVLSGEFRSDGDVTDSIQPATTGRPI